jgi:hypothetical protein
MTTLNPTAADIPVPPGHLVNDEPPATAAPINIDAPLVSGSPIVGQTLNCTMGNWDNEPTRYDYFWSRDGVRGGKGAADYTLVEADIGARMSCLLVATNAYGSVGAGSNAVGPVTAT